MEILWIIAALLLVLWLFGLVANVFGPILHLLLVVAAVLFVVSMFTGRRTPI
jgi:uncharacterized protein DUF5670